MRDFYDLKVWHKAHELTLLVYEMTRNFPKAELYGLTSQLRRGSASIPANLAEGCGRAGDRDFLRFCNIAMGSASELHYHLLLARDLKILGTNDYDNLIGLTIEVKRMLAGLIHSRQPEKRMTPTLHNS